MALSLLELRAWVGILLFLLLAAGFPITAILAWVFELTPDGVVKDRGAHASGDPKGKPVRGFLAQNRSAILAGNRQLVVYSSYPQVTDEEGDG